MFEYLDTRNIKLSVMQNQFFSQQLQFFYITYSIYEFGTEFNSEFEFIDLISLEYPIKELVKCTVINFL